VELFDRLSLAEVNSNAPLEPVFFELDQDELMAEGQAALQRNADWMRKFTGTRVSVTGHCDERGTNEYNLALGERRAAAVRDYLVGLGIARGRVTTVSRGEESPFCTESLEGCWSMNRRGHFLVTAK
jgi:peptidoglycan-associated lipoprotein